MSKKVNWATVDKRIRERRAQWSNEELNELEASLGKLPDLDGEYDVLDMAQPAVGTPEEENAEADPAEQPN